MGIHVEQTTTFDSPANEVPFAGGRAQRDAPLPMVLPQRPSKTRPPPIDAPSLDRLRAALTVAFYKIGFVLRDEQQAPEARIRSADRLLASCAIDLQAGEWSAGSAREDVRGGLAPWQVRRVQAHIECNLTKTMRIQELADVVRLSRFHFSRAFRASVQQSPHDYVMGRRVARACALMLTTRNSLCDIAIECGLADQAHLNRLFRKAVGETPGNWRRAHAPLESALGSGSPDGYAGARLGKPPAGKGAAG